MNASNVTTEDRVYAGVFGCIMLIGLPLNAASLWILLRRHSLKSPNAVFMVNLALSDLLLVFTLSMRIYFHATGRWTLGTWMCLIITMFFCNNILHHLHQCGPFAGCGLSPEVTPSSDLIQCLERSCTRLGDMDFLNHLHNQTQPTCFDYHEYHERSLSNIRLAVIYIQIVSLVMMLAVNIVCTIMVSWTLHRHLSDSAKVNNKVNVMLIFAINLVLFAMFLPVPISVAAHSTNVKPLVCLTARVFK